MPLQETPIEMNEFAHEISQSICEDEGEDEENDLTFIVSKQQQKGKMSR